MSVLLAAPLLLSLTLLVSGLAKLGAREGTEDAMASLRLPLRRAHRAVATVLPVAEIVLAVTLWIPVAGLQIAAAAVVAALMVAYLVVIARALGFEETVECSCFGTLASPTVSRSTLGRNLVLSGLGVLAVIAAISGVMTQAVLEAPLPLLGWAGALALTVALTVLALGGVDRTAASDAADTPDAAPAAGPDASAGDGHADVPQRSGDDAEDEELLDYEREPIPAGELCRAPAPAGLGGGPGPDGGADGPRPGRGRSHGSLGCGGHPGRRSRGRPGRLRGGRARRCPATERGRRRGRGAAGLRARADTGRGAAAPRRRPGHPAPAHRSAGRPVDLRQRGLRSL